VKEVLVAFGGMEEGGIAKEVLVTFGGIEEGGVELLLPPQQIRMRHGSIPRVSTAFLRLLLGLELRLRRSRSATVSAGSIGGSGVLGLIGESCSPRVFYEPGTGGASQPFNESGVVRMRGPPHVGSQFPW
jgi:hypothetical protein